MASMIKTINSPILFIQYMLFTVPGTAQTPLFSQNKPNSAVKIFLQ